MDSCFCRRKISQFKNKQSRHLVHKARGLLLLSPPQHPVGLLVNENVCGQVRRQNKGRKWELAGLQPGAQRGQVR